MNWNQLTESEQLATLNTESAQQKIILFKHSTSCSISIAALNRLERKWQESDNQLAKLYFLDLLKFRALSNEIASKYGVQHESPQVLIIENGTCTTSDSHFDITYEKLLQNLS
jgi:bacillithiol system protein YtxJ